VDEEVNRDKPVEAEETNLEVDSKGEVMQALSKSAMIPVTSGYFVGRTNMHRLGLSCLNDQGRDRK